MSVSKVGEPSSLRPEFGAGFPALPVLRYPLTSAGSLTIVLNRSRVLRPSSLGTQQISQGKALRDGLALRASPKTLSRSRRQYDHDVEQESGFVTVR